MINSVIYEVVRRPGPPNNLVYNTATTNIAQVKAGRCVVGGRFTVSGLVCGYIPVLHTCSGFHILFLMLTYYILTAQEYTYWKIAPVSC